LKEKQRKDRTLKKQKTKDLSSFPTKEKQRQKRTFKKQKIEEGTYIDESSSTIEY